MNDRVHIGCAGFTGRDWKGFFFPEGLPAKEELSHYSSVFNAVEINSTFYRKPRITTLENWYQRTPADFRFFIKIPKNITHVSKMVGAAQESMDFCLHIHSGIREKLAGFLYQFPPSFHYSADNLELILHNIAPGFTNVVEFRHESWWVSDAAALLAEHGIVFAGVSYPGKIPDDIMSIHPQLAYYRLHGVPVLFKSEYSEEFLTNVAEEVKKTNHEFYIFFNNTWGTAALKNGLQLNSMLL